MSRRILIVDNHPVMLKFMSELLSKEGNHVVTAEDGLAALDILKDFTPEVLFVDLIMPHVSGEKLCRIIRKNPKLRDAYVVILSAIAADEKIDFLAFGADACIAKAPFDQMRRHVLTVLKEAESGSRRTGSGMTIGGETMHPRQITRELLTVKHHFEVILETMKEGVVEITGNGRIVFLNQTALKLIGVPEDELIASRLTDLFQDSDRGKVERLLDANGNCHQNGGEALELVIGGKQASLKVLPLGSEDMGALVILEDLTERKLMEARLLRAQKMEAIGTLAGGIAHDFNNILTTIFGSISLAKLDAGPGSGMAERLEDIEQASWRAKELARQLLPFSKGGGPVRKRVSIQSIIREMHLTAQMDFRERTVLSFQDDLCDVDADEYQIKQAITHLVTNAFQAMPGGGKVRISAANSIVRGGNRLGIQSGKYVQISVEDQGPGIPDEHLSRIFDPYFSTRSSAKGLGLATVYSIMENHRGCVTVETKQNVGTVFHLYLPALEEADRVSSGDVQGAGRAEMRILLMDDEEMVRRVAGSMIEHLGYSVELVRDGTEVLSLYAKAGSNGKPFDLVILDLTVPGGMGGKETMEKLLQIDPGVRVIVSSGYSTDPIMTQHESWGFRGVLEKPYQMSELESELERVLQR